MFVGRVRVDPDTHITVKEVFRTEDLDFLNMVVQGLIDAEKEQRKRQKKRKGFVEEEEEKPKLEELEAGYGAFENGDTGLGERRSVTLCPSHHISDPTPAGCIAMFGGICTPCPGTWIDRSRDPTSYTANAIWQHQISRKLLSGSSMYHLKPAV